MKTFMKSVVGKVPTAVNNAPELITCQEPNVCLENHREDYTYETQSQI